MIRKRSYFERGRCPLRPAPFSPGLGEGVFGGGKEISGNNLGE